MINRQKLIVFLNSFGIGIFLPILSLFLLEHGCTLNSLAAIMGIYSVTVILSEVPTGIFSDMKGRKTSFYISCIFTGSSFTLMYFSSNIICLGIGIILFGLGRAFMSGTLDSLVIENCIHLHGEEHLSKYVSTNLIFQYVGIASGCLVGGIIPNIQGYLIHFLLRVVILFITCFLGKKFIKDISTTTTSKKYLKNAKHLLQGNYILYILLFCMLGMMFIVFSVETYWQPEFNDLLSEHQHYLLGIISASGYGATILGSILGGLIQMKSSKSRWIYYFIFSMLPPIILCLLAVQYNTLGFMLCYIIFLFTLGLVSVPEQTLLNSITSNKTRASLLSISSLFSQLGGVIISSISLGLLGTISVRGIWILAALLTMIVMILAITVLLYLHKKS